MRVPPRARAAGGYNEIRGGAGAAGATALARLQPRRECEGRFSIDAPGLTPSEDEACDLYATGRRLACSSAICR